MRYLNMKRPASRFSANENMKVFRCEKNKHANKDKNKIIPNIEKNYSVFIKITILSNFNNAFIRA